MTAPKRRFVRRLAVIAVVLAVVPVVAIGLALVDVNRKVLQERAEELLFAVTDDVAWAMAGALDDPRTQLHALAIVLADSEQPIADRMRAARSMVAASGHHAVAIYDDAGSRIDAIIMPDASWTGDPILAADLRETAARDGYAVGEVRAIGEGASVPLVVPITGQSTRWFAVAMVSLDPIADRLVSIIRDRFAGRFDAITVVDANLRFIVHADPERRLSPATEIDSLRGLDGAAIRAGILVFRDVGSTSGVVRSLPGLPWAVIAQLPHARVYAPVARARLLVLVATGGAAVLGLLAAILLSRRMAKPIGSLVELARDLGRRKFSQRTDVKTGDELETLALAMSKAAEDLEASDLKLQEEAAIRTQLRRYLPNKLVERIVAHDPKLALDGTRRRISVLFADIAAFTALAEREPPDRVVALLNQLFTLLTEIVFRHDGTVDKLIGDCLMAFWGAPDDQPDHAERAVAAAIDMQRWLDVANDCWESSLGLTIHLAIGVHTGDAIVGNLGSEARMEYTCVGDTVNVAARLESLARPQQILISESTRLEIDPSVRSARIGKRQLPGRMAPVELHEVIL